MKKLIDNVVRIKDRISHLKVSYSVWLVSRPSILSPRHIVFAKRLRELTGLEDSKEMKKLVKMWNGGRSYEKTDDWFLELEVKGRARISHGLSHADAEKLCMQISDIGGKAIVVQDNDDSAVTSERKALENDLCKAEAALRAEQQRVQRAMDDSYKMPDYSGMLTEDELEVIANFAAEHEVPYFITKDGLVDIFGDVEIWSEDLDEDYQLPFSFGRVYGDFDCSETGLSSLEGSPIHVDGDFDCSWNHLESFCGCPRYVGGDFTCVENEDYGDFEYDEDDLPEHIGGACILNDTDEEG